MELTGKLLVEQKQSLSVNQVQSLNILALILGFDITGRECS